VTSHLIGEERQLTGVGGVVVVEDFGLAGSGRRSLNLLDLQRVRLHGAAEALGGRARRGGGWGLSGARIGKPEGNQQRHREAESSWVSSGLVGLVWTGWVSSGLVGARLDWLGLVWTGWVSSGVVGSRLDWLGLVWTGWVSSGLVGSRLDWLGLVWTNWASQAHLLFWFMAPARCIWIRAGL